MMRRLVIKNIGPIREATLNLNKLNVFMGPQSSGKSTIAKIISYCTWVEKSMATNQSFEGFNKDFFKERLESFHKMRGYFNSGSVIEYDSGVIKLKYSANSFTVEWVDRYDYKRSKISYIPAERNMVILPEMEKVEFPHNNIRSFLFDWFDARKSYSSDGAFPILSLGINYYYSESSKENHIKFTENGDSKDILLSNASSGLQSIVPMAVMIEYLSNGIYNQEEEISFEEKENRQKTQVKLIDNLAHKACFGQPFPKDTERNEKIDLFNEMLKNREEEELKLIKEYRAIQSYLFTTQNSQLIIEEAEQNLFPETQRDFIYYLLEKCNNSDREHCVSLTTHSPYILYAINNCMMANLVWNNMGEEDKQKLKCKQSLIDPKKVSIYQISDGVINSIQGDDGLIGNNYFDEKMKELLGDFYVMLNYYN